LKEQQLMSNKAATMQTRTRQVDGLAIRYADTEPGNGLNIGRYLAERLPDSRLSILDTGHFAWEQVPDRYAAIVAEWVGRAEVRARHG
jgi:pimeloyl-ACP methyl ester carboxylesterase